MPKACDGQVAKPAFFMCTFLGAWGAITVVALANNLVFLLYTSLSLAASRIVALCAIALGKDTSEHAFARYTTF
jgi:hypothetical protein